jgi:hypothetical protein
MTIYYVTTYALTQGIQKVEGREEGVRYSDSRLVSYKPYGSAWLGVNAFETLEGAQDAAETKRLAKIVSLRKQLAKLEKYVPKVVDTTVKP